MSPQYDEPWLSKPNKEEQIVKPAFEGSLARKIVSFRPRHLRDVEVFAQAVQMAVELFDTLLVGLARTCLDPLFFLLEQDKKLMAHVLGGNRNEEKRSSSQLKKKERNNTGSTYPLLLHLLKRQLSLGFRDNGLSLLCFLFFRRDYLRDLQQLLLFLLLLFPAK
jgi:hypothetical protein